jgi:hypothetical protein
MVRSRMRTGAARAGAGPRVRAPDPVRAMIVAVIVLGHGALMFFMAQHVSVRQFPAGQKFSALPIHLIQIGEPDQVQPGRSRQESSPVETSSAQQSNPGDVNNLTESTEISSSGRESLEEVPGVRMDWTGAAAEADQRISQSRRKGFGEGSQDNQTSGRKTLGVFERGPPHRAGDIEMFEDGVERRWVNSRCYRDFGGPPDPLARRSPRVNLLNCLMGPREVEGDLFDHLKPGYLQQKK